MCVVIVLIPLEWHAFQFENKKIYMTNQISDNKNENYKYNIQYIIYEKYIFKLICILYQLK